MKIAKLPAAKPVLRPVMTFGEKPDKGPIKVKPLRAQSGIRLQSLSQAKPDPSPVVLQKFKLKKKESTQQADKPKIPPQKI